MRNFREYDIWQDGIVMTDLVYEVADALPSRERFNLADQLIRAACSIAANIAEGAAKSSEKDFKRYLEMSLGSAFEVETHLRICLRRSYLSEEKFGQLFIPLQSLQKRISKLINNIRDNQ